MISLYDLMARVLGTKPIHVTLAADVFSFESGNSRSYVRAASPDLRKMRPDLRLNALRGVLNLGFKGLASEATIQTPEIIFHNDDAIAEGFANQQRDALRQATKGLRSRFQS